MGLTYQPLYRNTGRVRTIRPIRTPKVLIPKGSIGTVQYASGGVSPYRGPEVVFYDVLFEEPHYAVDAIPEYCLEGID